MYPSDLDTFPYTGEKGYTAPLKIKGGDHDFMDQDLCIMAQTLKIDTLIFQREPGERRTNTEILDTRLNSYDFLRCIIDRDTLQRPLIEPDSKYPTVWFPQQQGQGFIYDRKRCFNVQQLDEKQLNVVQYQYLQPFYWDQLIHKDEQGRYLL